MTVPSHQEDDYTQDVLVALRQIQDTPAMQAEASTEPESVMNRLGLSGVARHAVAFSISAAIVGPVAANLVHAHGFWK
jgi:hypothetical protein